jgi:hypothetical protein
MRPAIKIIFAPLHNRDKGVRDKGWELHGKASGRTIWLDPRSKDILDTLVHEMTHVGHPSWGEKEVEAHTQRRLKKMSWKEKARLLKILGHAELEGESA